MISVLGLPLDEALGVLEQNGITGVTANEYAAPRGGITRGTLRVIRMSADGKTLTVCRFADDVNLNQKEQSNESDETVQ